MTRTTLLFSAAIAFATAAGCYTGPSTELSPATRGPGVSTDGTDPAHESGEPASAEAGAPVAEGLPCDVAKLLAASCTDCHGARPVNGAPNSLVTYDDLVAPSSDDPARKVAEVSLARMKSTKKPMPPEGPLAASEIAVLETWVSAGMPKGSCGTKTATPDAGPTPDGVDAGPMKDAAPEAASVSVCTSGVTFAPGTPSSALMQPGKACIACHSANGGPSFTLAGTVYPTLHEPDGCNGVPGNMSVVIVDAAGKSHTMPVNAAGNFIRVTNLPMPYTAKVVNGPKSRVMKTPQTNGDCNSCHTERGDHAPGRITAP